MNDVLDFDSLDTLDSALDALADFDAFDSDSLLSERVDTFDAETFDASH